VDGALDRFVTDAYGEHIEELLPAGLSRLFFFDGERIERFDPERSAEALRTAVHVLLGITSSIASSRTFRPRAPEAGSARSPAIGERSMPRGGRSISSASGATRSRGLSRGAGWFEQASERGERSKSDSGSPAARLERRGEIRSSFKRARRA